MRLLLGLSTLSKVGCGWWWLKGSLEFRFGPNVGLTLEAETNLKNFVFIFFKFQMKILRFIKIRNVMEYKC